MRSRFALTRGVRFVQTNVCGPLHFACLGPHRPAFLDGQFDRIYHVHSRKTGGTSVNKMFLALSGTPDVDALYERLATPPFNVGYGDWRFSGWSARSLRYPQFDYGFSHVPLNRLALPPRTFRFTILRDPISRVCSLYDMLAGFRDAGSSRSDVLPQIEWVKDGFAGFLESAPQSELSGQLAMFSSGLDAGEALETLAGLEMVIPLARLDEGLRAMGTRFGVHLRSQHLRKAKHRYEPTLNELGRLAEILAEEIAFYEKALLLADAKYLKHLRR